MFSYQQRNYCFLLFLGNLRIVVYQNNSVSGFKNNNLAGVYKQNYSSFTGYLVIFHDSTLQASG